MTTSEQIRRDIRDEFRDRDFTDVRFSYGHNHFLGRSIYNLLANTDVTFEVDPHHRIHYDRSDNRFHLRFTTPNLNYSWSLIAHESAHCFVDFYYGLRTVDDEVCAHLFQVAYFRRRVGNYNMGFSSDTPAGRVFDAAIAIVQSHGLTGSSARAVSSDDVVELKSALRAYGYHN